MRPIVADAATRSGTYGSCLPVALLFVFQAVISMQFDLSYDQIAILAFTALVAGCARGFSGFGGALIFVPIATSVVEPRLAVPLLLIVDLVLTPGLLPKALRNADRGDVGWM